MREEQIAQRLKESIPQEPHVERTEFTQAPTETGYTAQIDGNLDTYKLYEYFGIDLRERDGHTEAKLNQIHQWAAEATGSSDYLTVANHIRAIEQALGGGNNTDNRLEKLYRFLRIDGQIRNMMAEQRLIYG